MTTKHLLLYLLLGLSATHLARCSSSAEKSTNLPPCRACKAFVESFKKGMERTKNGKFEGGDADWEEKRLGPYATSEIRLVEIHEKVCADLKEGKDQCYALLERHDVDIEVWWFNYQTDRPDMFEYFCIETARYCCPELHYGPECEPCAGFPDRVCSRNGRCKGAGTRKGSGKCDCEPGYAGAACDACTDEYYESYRDEDKLLCSKCHVACRGGCVKAGAIGCKNCGIGWLETEEAGCTDVNECAAPTFPCSINQFCVNNDGSFKCLECDRSCAGCTGDGPDMCNMCAIGYILVDQVCVDAEQESRKSHVFLTRYLTYLGLCIATCIVFNKNTFLAAIIGLAVAIYITMSEWILNSPPTPNTDGLAEQIMQKTAHL